MNVTAYGERALRVQLDSLTDVHRFAHALRQQRIPGVVEVVPAWTTVLVVLDDGVAPQEIRTRLGGLPLTEVPAAGREHVLPVTYDGPDLDRVAQHAGVSSGEVVDRHLAGNYTVAFLGFVPGFGYLSGLDPRLATPRLASPRPTVPPGSVAIADEVTAVYPAPTPGGWNIIGRTDVVLFDPASDTPARLAPGDRVRFRAV